MLEIRSVRKWLGRQAEDGEEGITGARSQRGAKGWQADAKRRALKRTTGLPSSYTAFPTPSARPLAKSERNFVIKSELISASRSISASAHAW